MTDLAMGSNTAITAADVRVTLRWTPAPGSPDVDASALLLGATGKVGSDADFVFYNQPADASGAVRHAGKQTGADTVDVALGNVPAHVERIVLAASADGGTFGQVPGLAVEVNDTAGTLLARFAMSATTETAFVSGELYRRDGGWKFRAVGQGYDSGLGGLATDFGISVDDGADSAPPPPPAAAQPPPSAAAPPPPPAAAPPPPPPPQPPSSAAAAPPPPVFEQPAPVINLDKVDTAGRVNLVKGSRVSLVKTGAAPLTRVVMGLGWDPARGKGKIDLDASCIAFDASGRKIEIVWFLHLKEFRGALTHTGDSLTGQGEGDDEQIHVDLAALPDKVASLVFTITSFRGQKFTEVARAFCRLVDATTDQELVRYDLSDAEPATGVLMAMLRRTAPTVWEMRALGEFHDAKTVKKLVDPAARHAAAP